MIVTIHQPEYLPWLGFFDRIQQSDVFVVLDDVGYQKNGFINRNKIKTDKGEKWITVPVVGRSPNLKINEILIDNSKDWKKSQLGSIISAYSKTPYFKEYLDFFKKTFGRKWEKMSELDIYLIENIVEILGIKTKIKVASSIEVDGNSTERLVNICKSLGADTYLSGPGGKDYMDLGLFKKEGINVIFQEFSHPGYNQTFKEQGFISGMSIIDLLFNCGSKSLEIIKLGGKNNI